MVQVSVFGDSGLEVQFKGLGFRVSGHGLRGEGLGSGVNDEEFWVWGWELGAFGVWNSRVTDFEYQVSGLGFGFRFRGSGFRVRVSPSGFTVSSRTGSIQGSPFRLQGSRFRV